MIRENNKKSNCSRTLLSKTQPLITYTHIHTHEQSFQSGHQAVAEVSHGHHVCWPMASRLINKLSGMQGQIRDRCGGGAGKRWVGGENKRGSLDDDDRLRNERATYSMSKKPVNVLFAIPSVFRYLEHLYSVPSAFHGGGILQ